MNWKGIPEREKLYYLKRYLAGDAKTSVDGYLMFPSTDGYQLAMQLLEDRYGDPFTVADAFRTKLENWPKIMPKDGFAIRKLFDYLNQCLAAMASNPSLHILNDERENRKILRKLPDWINNRWVRVVAESREHSKTFPPFSTFAQFITKEAKISCDPSASPHAKL